MNQLSVFIDAPLTLAALNQRLEECISKQSFAPLKIETDKEGKLSIQQLFQAINYPLRSFPDIRDKTQVSLLKRKLVQLFPVCKENMSVHQSIAKAIDKITDPEAAAKALQPVMEAAMVASVRDLQLNGHTPILIRATDVDPLKIIQKHVSEKPEKRLEGALAYNPSPRNDQEKAQKLQTILSLMARERRLMQLHWLECQTALQAHEAKLRFREDSTGTVRLNALIEQTEFTCPDVVENSEEWAFRLQMADLFTRSSACVQQILRSPHTQATLSFLRLSGKLQVFMNDESTKSWNWLVKKVRDHVQAQVLMAYFLRRTQNVLDEIKDVSQLPLLTETRCWLDVEDIVAPYGSFILDTTNKAKVKTQRLLQCDLLPGDLDPAMYRQKEATCKAYLANKEHQEALYHYAFGQLTALVASKAKQMEWKKYLKDLSPESIRDLILKDRLPPFDLAVVDPISEFIKLAAATPEQEATVQVPSIKLAATPPPVKAPKPPTPKLVPITHEAPCPPSVPLEVIPPVAPVNVFTFPMAARVQRWYECPVEGPLDPEIFWDYTDSSSAHARWMKIIHGFSLSVHQFHDIGIKTVWNNPTTGNADTLYVIPADIHVKEQKYRGFINLCIGVDGSLYHQDFVDMLKTLKIKDAEFIMKISQRSFDASDFPDLKMARFRDRDLIRRDHMSPVNDPVTIHPLLGTVTIFDRRLNITLKLYRTNSLFSL